MDDRRYDGIHHLPRKLRVTIQINEIYYKYLLQQSILQFLFIK